MSQSGRLITICPDRIWESLNLFSSIGGGLRGPAIALQTAMRPLALVLLASLALSTPGCTLAGTGAGASVGAVHAGNTPKTQLSVSDYAKLGVVIGLVVGAIAFGNLLNSYGNNFHLGKGDCPSCD
jgi:hypothetical protein